MRTSDRRVLRVLQALVLGLPLFLGGRHPLGVTLGLATVLSLLAWTCRERARRPDPPLAVGTVALAAFVALGLATTLPLPPPVLALLSPRAFELYRDMLPGWPAAGGWDAWRPLALDAHGVWVELCRIGIGLGAFVVVVAYPWTSELPDEDPREDVFATLLLTLVAGGAALSLLALVHGVTGGERVLWVLDPVRTPGRSGGPFANPNHFAAWLEMVIPLGVAYLGAVALRTGRHVARMARASQAMGVQARRAWAGALASHQRSFWLPLLVLGAVLVMLVAHAATGSRGGTMSLLAGLAVVGLGFARRSRGGRRSSRTARIVSASIVAALLLASLVTVVGWARLEDAIAQGGEVDGEVGLLTRVAVGEKGRGVVADFPLVGTGLGSWRHAFPLHQAPPVEGGIWEHAHDDYLELAAETGVAGVAIVAWFVFLVASAARGRRGADGVGADGGTPRPERPAGFAPADWRAAFARASWLRFGVCGGITAILVHSFVDFGLRLPANLLLLGVLAGMLLLARPLRASRPSHAVAVFALLLAAPAVPLAAGAVRELAGGAPASAASAIARADAALAEDDDRPRAVALARHAVELSPADRAAHEAMAIALGDGPEGEQALRRAVVLDPWAVELRDWLASRLAARGESARAAAELEESIARYPYVVSHVLPEPASSDAGPTGWLADLAGQDTLRVRLAALDPVLADAVERGLERALAERPAGRERQVVADDLVLLLEARGRPGEAGATLRDTAGITPEDAPRLARAAANFLEDGDAEAAQEVLVAALRLTPERGDLYRRLAVDVFAARGDFAAAEQVLRVAQRNSQDMIPVYRGLTRVLSMRESARFAAAVRDPGAEESRAAEEEMTP